MPSRDSPCITDVALEPIAWEAEVKSHVGTSPSYWLNDNLLISMSGLGLVCIL
jgi:hypothetical protein